MYQLTNIIYIYLLIVLSLIVFNISYVIYDGLNKYFSQKKYIIYKNKIIEGIKYLNQNNNLEEKHIKYFIRKLNHVNNLIIYKKVISDLKDNKYINKYLEKSILIYQVLSNKYLNKNSIKKTYFSYFISQLPIKKLKENFYIVNMLLENVIDKSIYCRTNSMIAICKLDSKELVNKALLAISKRNLYYNNKKLEENLLEYSSNKDSLIKELLYNFNKFTNNIKLAIINYIKHTSGNYTKNLYELFISQKYDKEINLAIIDYFGKYEYKKIVPVLLEIVNKYEHYDIEYTIRIINSLAKYDQKNVRYTLIELLSNDNWYIRKYATISLSKLTLTDKEIKDINKLNNNYDKQMFNYVFNKRINNNTKEKKERKQKEWIHG